MKKIFYLFFALFLFSLIFIAACSKIENAFEPEAKYEKTDNKLLIDVRTDLEQLKTDLREQGLYDCCIKNDCNWCAIYMGHCDCNNLVKEKGKEKSCPECAAAWNRKMGRIEGVDPKAIEVTTFGIYGYEEGGHHFIDSLDEDHMDEIDDHHDNEDDHHD